MATYYTVIIPSVWPQSEFWQHCSRTFCRLDALLVTNQQCQSITSEIRLTSQMCSRTMRVWWNSSSLWVICLPHYNNNNKTTTDKNNSQNTVIRDYEVKARHPALYASAVSSTIYSSVTFNFDLLPPQYLMQSSLSHSK